MIRKWIVTFIYVVTINFSLANTESASHLYEIRTPWPIKEVTTYTGKGRAVSGVNNDYYFVKVYKGWVGDDIAITFDAGHGDEWVWTQLGGEDDNYKTTVNFKAQNPNRYLPRITDGEKRCINAPGNFGPRIICSGQNKPAIITFSRK